MKILAQLSGGLDSIASTIKVAETGNEFSTVFYNMDQPYIAQETHATELMVNWLKKRYPNYQNHYTIDLPVKQEHTIDGTPSEYVPVRNLVLASSSANLALSRGYKQVAVGSKTIAVRPEDPYSFADCSIEFYNRVTNLVNFCSEKDQGVEFTMPLVDMVNKTSMSKKEVIEYIFDSGYNPSLAWSCYRSGVTKHCGECYHCVEIKKTGLWNIFA